MKRSKIGKSKFTISREKAYLLVLMISASLYLCLVTPSYASAKYEQFTKQQIKSLIISNSKKYMNINQNLALGLARILSNFDPGAIGPKQRVGVFQLHPNEFAGTYTKRQLLSPSLNVSLGLRKFSRLLDEAYGDEKRALIYYNQHFLVGPWPNSKILRVSNSFSENVLAAKSAFEQNNTRIKVDFAQHSEHNFDNQKLAKKTRIQHKEKFSDLNWKRHIHSTNVWLKLFEKNKLQLNETKMSPSLFSTF